MSIASSKFLPLVLILAWVSNTGSMSFGQGTSSTLNVRTPAEYRQFAMQNEGDAAQGGKLFADEQRLACSKCHSVDGRGSKAGPDLATAGDQFARRDLIDAVLLPSAAIAVGYSTTSVETKSGEAFQGVLKQVTDDWIELMGGDGQRVRIATNSIHEQRGCYVCN